MATLAQIYDWFMTGKKPTQAQFWASWGSFWNKSESIPQSAVSNLSSTLNAKAEREQFELHKQDANAHPDLFAAVKISGRFLINRNNLIFFADEPTAGDTVTGMVEGEYLNAGTFYGGNFEQLSSYVEPNLIGRILSYSNGSISVEVNEGIISRLNTSGGPICNVRITTPDGTIFEDALYSFEERLSNPINTFLQGSFPFGSVFVLYDPLSEFEDSLPFVYEQSVPVFTDLTFDIVNVSQETGIVLNVLSGTDKTIVNKLVHYSEFGDLRNTYFFRLDQLLFVESNGIETYNFYGFVPTYGQINIENNEGRNVSNLFIISI
ncbi:hypothetical protein [Flavobacterium sp. GNP001]